MKDVPIIIILGSKPIFKPQKLLQSTLLLYHFTADILQCQTNNSFKNIHYILNTTLRPFYAPYLSELSCKPPSAVALVPSLCVYLDVSYDIILKIPVLASLLNQIAVAWNSSSRLKNGTFKPLKQCGSHFTGLCRTGARLNLI